MKKKKQRDSHQGAEGVIEPVVQREPLHHFKKRGVVKATGVSGDKFIHAMFLSSVSVYPAKRHREKHTVQRRGHRWDTGRQQIIRTKQEPTGGFMATSKGKLWTLTAYIVNLHCVGQRKEFFCIGWLKIYITEGKLKGTVASTVCAYMQLGMSHSLLFCRRNRSSKIQKVFEEVLLDSYRCILLDVFNRFCHSQWLSLRSWQILRCVLVK